MTEYQNKLIEDNIGIAYWIANKWEHKQDILDRDELVSEALYGLTKAATKYDASRNAKFATYAKISIDSDIIDLLRINKRKLMIRNTIELTEMVDTSKEASYEHENLDMLIDIDTKLSKVKPVHREIFNDFYKEGLTQEEIAVKNSMSQPNVYKILKRVVKEIAA